MDLSAPVSHWRTLPHATELTINTASALDVDYVSTDLHVAWRQDLDVAVGDMAVEARRSEDFHYELTLANSVVFTSQAIECNYSFAGKLHIAAAMPSDHAAIVDADLGAPAVSRSAVSSDYAIGFETGIPHDYGGDLPIAHARMVQSEFLFRDSYRVEVSRQHRFANISALLTLIKEAQMANEHIASMPPAEGEFKHYSTLAVHSARGLPYSHARGVDRDIGQSLSYREIVVSDHAIVYGFSGPHPAMEHEIPFSYIRGIDPADGTVPHAWGREAAKSVRGEVEWQASVQESKVSHAEHLLTAERQMRIEASHALGYGKSLGLNAERLLRLARSGAISHEAVRETSNAYIANVSWNLGVRADSGKPVDWASAKNIDKALPFGWIGRVSEDRGIPVEWKGIGIEAVALLPYEFMARVNRGHAIPTSTSKVVVAHPGSRPEHLEMLSTDGEICCGACIGGATGIRNALSEFAGGE